MPARLPIPGSDNDTWGTILNDFLSQSLTSNGELQDNVVGTDQVQNTAITKAKLESAVQTSLDKADAALPAAQKGAASGVASLDGSTRLTASQLPTTVGTKSETKAVVIHGATASTARPSGYGSVEWIGSVEPLNAIDGDTWIDTTT